MSFCIRCGRDVEFKDLVHGYCVDCFLKYVGIFRSKPIIKITMCPKCNSIFYGNTWINHDQEKVFKEIVRNKIPKFLNERVKLVDLVFANDIYHHMDFGQNTVDVSLKLNVNETHLIEVSDKVVITIDPKLCRKCFMRSAGTHKALVQIRFEDTDVANELLDKVNSFINRALNELKLESSIVDIEQPREGMDIKFNDIGSARRFAYYISNKLGAKIIESFKTTKFDSKRGKRTGILTLSIRIPLFKKGDLIVYKDRVGIIMHVRENKIQTWFPELNRIDELSISHYWDGILKKLINIEELEEYVALNIDDKNIILSSTKTGEIKQIPLKPSVTVIQPGDRVILIPLNNKELIIPSNMVKSYEQKSIKGRNTL
ncbi:MAG: 60S ribosomal export protein NMD3 [Desulfurococcaceae archaeon]